MQGSEQELVFDEVNSYQRAIQHQQLAKPQFGAALPPGFYIEVLLLSRGSNRHFPCWDVTF